MKTLEHLTREVIEMPSDESQDDTGRDEIGRIADRTYEDARGRLEEGERPERVLEVAIGTMADEWRRSVESGGERTDD